MAGWVGLCRTRRKPILGGSMAPSMAPTVLQRPTHPTCQVSCGRGREGRNQGQEQKKKRQPMAAFSVSASGESGSDPFAPQRALTPALDPAFAHPPPRGGWKGRVGRAARDRWRHGWRHRAPMDGFTACPGQPCRPGSRHDAQRGNALNLTAPRKYPLRPCRCRCTSSPCRTSAGDDAGRAAGSRYGSRRSHPAGGPGRSRRPAG